MCTPCIGQYRVQGAVAQFVYSPACEWTFQLIGLSICPSVCQSICHFVHPFTKSVYPLVRQSICHSVSLCSIHLSVRLQSVCLSVIQCHSSLLHLRLSVNLSLLHLHPFICQSVSMSYMFYLSLICHSVVSFTLTSICLSIYLSVLSYIFSLSFCKYFVRLIKLNCILLLYLSE